MLIFFLLAVYLPSQVLTKGLLDCGCSMMPSKRWAKAETRDRVLLPAARGFAWFCIWLWLEAQAPAQQNRPAQHSSVQRQLGTAGSRLAKKWLFSTVMRSQPKKKKSLDCKLSSSAPLLMRAVLFVDNNITPEGDTTSRCLPAGLGTAVRLLIFTPVAWSNGELVETSSTTRADHPCPRAGRKCLPVLRELVGHGCRRGEGKARSASRGLSKGTTANTSSSQQQSKGGTRVKFGLILD